MIELSEFIKKVNRQVSKRLVDDPIRQEYCVAGLANLFCSILFNGLNDTEIDEVVSLAKTRLRTKSHREIADDLERAERQSNEQFFGSITQ
jgi:hypothetical protein